MGAGTERAIERMGTDIKSRVIKVATGSRTTYSDYIEKEAKRT